MIYAYVIHSWFRKTADGVGTAGAFYWDYSVDSHSGVGITEHTEYQFPKEHTENRIAAIGEQN